MKAPHASYLLLHKKKYIYLLQLKPFPHQRESKKDPPKLHLNNLYVCILSGDAVFHVTIHFSLDNKIKKIRITFNLIGDALPLGKEKERKVYFQEKVSYICAGFLFSTFRFMNKTWNWRFLCVIKICRHRCSWFMLYWIMVFKGEIVNAKQNWMHGCFIKNLF